MKKRVSLLLIVLLALALAIALSSCGEHEHVEADPKIENDFAGNCMQVASHDEVVYCVDCGEELSRVNKPTNELGDHVWADPVYENVDVVNCKDGGVCDKVTACTVEGCGEVKRESVEAPKAEHSLKTKTVYDITPALCDFLTSVTKKTVQYCENCSYEKVTKEVTEQKDAGHAYSKTGICTYCSAVQSTTSGVEYRENGDGTYTLVGIKSGSKVATLRVGYYNDKPVTHIAEGAFKNSSVKFVTIGSTVKYIGADAFAGCAINNVNIYSLKDWCEIEFANAQANPAAVSSIFTINGKKLGGVLVLPEDVTKVSSFAFANTAIYGLHLPTTLKSVSANAFNNCTSLKNIHINGAQAKVFAANAFEGCEAIENVYAESLTSWLKITFEDVSANPAAIADNFYVGGKAVGTALEIPEGTVVIKPYAFASLDFESVKLPASLKVIDKGAFAGCSALTKVEFAENALLTVVGAEAFKSCVKLSSIVIPAGIEKIGSSAFEGCADLTEFAFGAKLESIGNNAFAGCAKLSAIELNSGLKTIGDGAFKGCVKVDSVFVPASVTSIGFGAFEGCSGVEKVTVPFVGGSALENTHFGYIFGAQSADLNRKFVPYHLAEVELTGSAKIFASAFSGCEGLMSIKLPASISAIGSGAFEGCTSLTEVYYPNLNKWCLISFENYSANPLSVADNLYIGENLVTDIVIDDAIVAVAPYAFYGATCLTSVKLESGIVAIGNDAFAGCTSLESLTVPASVKLIMARAFNGCTALKEVNAESVDAWSQISFEDAFANPLYYADALKVNGEKVTKVNLSGLVVNAFSFVGYEALSEVVLADSVKIISESAFRGCTGLTKINLSKVNTVADNAFKGCSALAEIALSEVIAVGNNAFDGCVALKKIIASKAKTIGNSAFAGCIALTEVTLGDNLTDIGISAFRGCASLTKATYPATANVGDFAFDGCPLK